MARLWRLLRVRPHEVGRVRRMVALSACIGLAIVTTQTAAFALFLERRGPDELPAAFLATGIGAAAVGFAYLRLGDRLAFPTLLVANLATIAVAAVGVRLGLAWDDHGIVVFLLPLWFQLLTNQVLLAFWGLAGSLFDVRQSKRLYGVLATGQATAVALGGLVTPFVVDGIGTANLLWLAVAGMVGAVAVLVHIAGVDLGARRPARRRADGTDAHGRPGARTAAGRLRRPLRRLGHRLRVRVLAGLLPRRQPLPREHRARTSAIPTGWPRSSACSSRSSA